MDTLGLVTWGPGFRLPIACEIIVRAKQSWEKHGFRMCTLPGGLRRTLSFNVVQFELHVCCYFSLLPPFTLGVFEKLWTE